MSLQSRLGVHGQVEEIQVLHVVAKRGREKKPVEEKKLPQRLVRNAGIFYVCYRLSQMGWNAHPRTRYAKGPNVVIHSEDEERTWRLKVRSLSKRAGTVG